MRPRLIFMIMVFLLGSTHVAQAQSSMASNGVLDLAGISLDSAGYVPLEGKWHFAWNALVYPDNKADFKTIDVPGYWALDGYENQGYATYRLQVNMDRPYEGLAIKIPDISACYRLYIDDDLVAEIGVPGMSADSSMPGIKPQVVSIYPKNDAFTITIQVANFVHKKGGLWEQLLLGKKDNLLRLQERNRLYDMFMIGAILIICLYHASLFVLRPNDYSALYFSLLCVFALFRVAGTNEMLVLMAFPNIPWEWRVSMEHVPFYMLIAVGCMFVQSLFPKQFDRRVGLAMLAVGCLFSLANLLLPALLHSYLVLYYEWYILLAFAFLAYVIAKAIQSREEGGIVLSFGLFVIFATAINDMLYAENVIHTFYMVPFGIFIFFFSQALVLSIRSAITFKKTEMLSAEMLVLNASLEEKVAERTLQLEQKNRQIGLVNEHLTLSEAEARLNSEELKAALGQLREAHLKLVKSEKMAMLGELVAGITHEINNPINFVLSGTTVMKSLFTDLQHLLDKYESAEQASYEEWQALMENVRTFKKEIIYSDIKQDAPSVISDMENGIFRVVEIIKGLKTFSRGENAAPQPTNIHLCIDSSLTILKSQYKGRIAIEKHYAPDLPPVTCLAGPLDQALINIIGNAIQAIENEGVISITTAQEAPKHVRIQISDTGIGIPKALMQQIFEPFFTTKEVGTGTGLGLSITADIIRKHNGRIEVQSEEGKGTIFSLILPVDMKA